MVNHVKHLSSSYEAKHHKPLTPGACLRPSLPDRHSALITGLTNPLHTRSQTTLWRLQVSVTAKWTPPMSWQQNNMPR